MVPRANGHEWCDTVLEKLTGRPRWCRRGTPGRCWLQEEQEREVAMGGCSCKRTHRSNGFWRQSCPRRSLLLLGLQAPGLGTSHFSRILQNALLGGLIDGAMM